MPRFVAVSHAIEPGMKTYPRLPEPRAEIVMDYQASHDRHQGKAEFVIVSLHLGGNTGEYVDAPIRRYRDGAELASPPLDAGIPVCEHMTNLAGC